MIKELQILGKLFTPSISTSDRVENCKKSEGCYLFQGSMICFCRMTLLIWLKPKLENLVISETALTVGWSLACANMRFMTGSFHNTKSKRLCTINEHSRF